MRLAPIPMRFLNDEKMLDYSAKSSIVTHAQEDCVSACVVLANMIRMAIIGKSKEDILSILADVQISDNIKHIIIDQTYRTDADIIGSGYVVKSLEAALWAFNKGDSFEECVLLAVNLGDDADTTGAITGQLAGAYYGFNSIPENWSKSIALYDVIHNISAGLYQAA
jgi:ADP-ribosyl-[dinitrogen reductase] hydrolase